MYRVLLYEYRNVSIHPSGLLCARLFVVENENALLVITILLYV